jgi:predicted Zn-dependent protease
LGLASALSLLALLPSSVSAQQNNTALSRLTTEVLIGQAVSLSNQSYPDIENAIQRFRNSDIQGALLFLEKAAEKHPNLPPVEVTMAKMQTLARNGKAVHALLESAAVKYPSDPEAFLILADQAFAGGRTTEASALFEKANTLNQQFDKNAKRKRSFVIRVLAGRAAVTERRQQWQQAAELLKEWVELDPENTTAHQRYGIVLFRLKKTSEAYEQFVKSREGNSKAPNPDILMGKLYAQEGDKIQARKVYEKAYAEEKSNMITAQAYAEWLIQDEKLNDAEKIISEVLKQDSESIPSLTISSIISLMNGKSDQAEKTLQKILTFAPSNATAINLLAQLLIERNDQSAQERALSYAQTNARQFPKSSQSNITLAWVYYKQGHLQEAQSALNAGLQRGGLTMDSTYLVARLMAEQGRNEPAIQALTQVVDKNGLFIHRKQAQELLAKLQSEK